MKAIYLIIIILLILSFSLGILSRNIFFTGQVVQNKGSRESSWTKAICNSENECIDVLITCKDEEVVRIEPVSNVIKFPENWKDPRGSFSDNLCENFP